MDVTPICPYCGRRMIKDYERVDKFRYKCLDCLALSPTKNTPKRAWKAAMCRQRKGPLTVKEMEARLNAILNPEPEKPSQRPLEWEEIPDHQLVYLELRGIDKPIPSILRQTIDDQAFYTMESGHVNTYFLDDLGKRWRVWAQKPTDEERSAEEWM